MQLQQASADPQGAQKLGWPFRDIPDWGKGPDLCTSTQISHWMRATPREGCILGKVASSWGGIRLWAFGFLQQLVEEYFISEGHEVCGPGRLPEYPLHYLGVRLTSGKCVIFICYCKCFLLYPSTIWPGVPRSTDTSVWGPYQRNWEPIIGEWEEKPNEEGTREGRTAQRPTIIKFVIVAVEI